MHGAASKAAALLRSKGRAACCAPLLGRSALVHMQAAKPTQCHTREWHQLTAGLVCWLLVLSHISTSIDELSAFWYLHSSKILWR